METYLANILIVADESETRPFLRMVSNSRYKGFATENGDEAVRIIREIGMDVVFLDLGLLSEIEVIRGIRSTDPEVILNVIAGPEDASYIPIEAIRYGIFNYVRKPFNVFEIRDVIEKSFAQRKRSLSAREFLAMSNGNGGTSPSGKEDYLKFFKVLIHTLEARDPYTLGHSERVCFYSNFMSERLGFNIRAREAVRIASYLHDIGKFGISSYLMNKKEALSPSEWAIIKQHSRKSIDLLVPLNLSSDITSYIYHHHERFDGTGYPDGLSGEKIPLGARIIAVADAYDSMTSVRPYRQPLSSEEARKELVLNSGIQFDPQIVRVFLDILKGIEAFYLVPLEYMRISSFMNGWTMGKVV